MGAISTEAFTSFNRPHPILPPTGGRAPALGQRYCPMRWMLVKRHFSQHYTLPPSRNLSPKVGESIGKPG